MKVLFVCQHGAGKSLLAATYFDAAARRHGAQVEVDTAGPEPDEHNMPGVVEVLAAEGHVAAWAPSLLTPQDLDAADVAVDVGCDPGALPAPGIVRWDVPQLSDGLAASRDAIRARAESLADELFG